MIRRIYFYSVVLQMYQHLSSTNIIIHSKMALGVEFYLNIQKYFRGINQNTMAS